MSLRVVSVLNSALIKVWLMGMLGHAQRYALLLSPPLYLSAPEIIQAANTLRRVTQQK